MRYRLKEKLWTFSDQFTIADEDEREHFFVKGKAFSWGDKLTMEDATGADVAYIEQKMLSFRPRYTIYRDGALFAEITKEFAFFKSKFTLDVPGPNDYEITGSFMSHEYEFVRGGSRVATVSKKLWSWSDSYGVDIIDGEDDVAILCTVVVIDLVCHENEGGGGASIGG